MTKHELLESNNLEEEMDVMISMSQHVSRHELLPLSSLSYHDKTDYILNNVGLVDVYLHRYMTYYALWCLYPENQQGA